MSREQDYTVCAREPYGYVIEYSPSEAAGQRRAFTPNVDGHDLAQVMQRAADLHGIVIPVYRQERPS